MNKDQKGDWEPVATSPADKSLIWLSDGKHVWLGTASADGSLKQPGGPTYWSRVRPPVPPPAGSVRSEGAAGDSAMSAASLVDIIESKSQRIAELEAQRDTIRNETIEECAREIDREAGGDSHAGKVVRALKSEPALRT